MSWSIHGYREAGLGTAHPEQWLTLLLDHAGWQLQWEGASGSQPLWPQGEATPDHEWLLTRPGRDHGQLRLFRFTDRVPAPRAGADNWDTGGIFDLDVRVRNLKAWYVTLRELGWRAISEPVDWPFGELQVREWLARGPDDVILALMQRLAPSLPSDAQPGAGFSAAFNSSQTVRDFNASLAFYEALGFRLMVRHEAPLGGRGGEVIGLSPDVASETTVALAIMHPQAVLEGSVELVALPDRAGRDLSAACGPARRGLNLLRFPVQGLDALLQHLATTGIASTARARWDLPGWGEVEGVAVVSPDGAWLELIEARA
ncbi:MAG: VOC family protein [Pseudomonadota bacterium]